MASDCDNLCPTSGAETTDPYLSLAGDTGEVGAIATCNLCGARLGLEAGVPRPRFPAHRPPGRTRMPPEAANGVGAARAPPPPLNDASAFWARARREILEVERRAHELASELERDAPPGGCDAETVRRLREAGSHLISASARAGVLARGVRL
jgi:hypothetical protein